MRLFVGIPLHPAVIDELTKITNRLRAKEDNLRWTAPESWHITLQFLGTTTPQQYVCLIERLSELHAPPIPIYFDTLGLFDRAGIFFAGIEPSPALLTLHQRITAATSPCGFTPETRPYHPHITLARTKSREGTQTLRNLKTRIPQNPKLPPFTAEAFVLYESFTGPTGSRYAINERFPLDSRR
jgi:2'-5' RNA ligase